MTQQISECKNVQLFPQKLGSLRANALQEFNRCIKKVCHGCGNKNNQIVQQIVFVVFVAIFFVSFVVKFFNHKEHKGFHKKHKGLFVYSY
jgi:hypothetical protein